MKIDRPFDTEDAQYQTYTKESKTFSDFISNSPNAKLNIATTYSSIFQIHYSDIFLLGKAWSDEVGRFIFNRLVDSQQGVTRPKAKTRTLTPAELPNNSIIRFVVAYVDPSDGNFSYSSDAKGSGMFLWIKVVNTNLTLTPDMSTGDGYDSCSESNFNSTTRIYLGSDSHGNLQAYEPSVQDWLDDPNNIDLPSSKCPLQGEINRIQFRQGIPTKSGIDNWLNNSLIPNSGSLKLDFPNYVTSGYSVMVQDAFWREISTNVINDQGRTRSQPFYNVPNITPNPRLGLQLEYWGSYASNYLIMNDLTKTLPVNERTKYNELRFYLGDDENGITTDPYFHLYVYVKLSYFKKGIKYYTYKHIQGSPYINSPSISGNYFKVPLNKTVNNSNSYFNLYILNLDDALDQLNLNYTLESIDQIKIRGSNFDLTNIGLRYTPSSLFKNKTTQNDVDVRENEEINLISYPNPFNPKTNVTYSIYHNGYVKLKIFNSLGKLVKTLVDEYQEQGEYSLEFNGAGLPSGIYFSKLEVGSMTKIGKMLLIK